MSDNDDFDFDLDAAKREASGELDQKIRLAAGRLFGAAERQIKKALKREDIPRAHMPDFLDSAAINLDRGGLGILLNGSAPQPPAPGQGQPLGLAGPANNPANQAELDKRDAEIRDLQGFLNDMLINANLGAVSMPLDRAERARILKDLKQLAQAAAAPAPALAPANGVPMAEVKAFLKREAKKLHKAFGEKPAGFFSTAKWSGERESKIYDAIVNFDAAASAYPNDPTTGGDDE